jgi:hypothetical protein
MLDKQYYRPVLFLKPCPNANPVFAEEAGNTMFAYW